MGIFASIKEFLESRGEESTEYYTCQNADGTFTDLESREAYVKWNNEHGKVTVVLSPFDGTAIGTENRHGEIIASGNLIKCDDGMGNEWWEKSKTQ